MFVEMVSIQEEMKKLNRNNVARTCLDVKMESPDTSSGAYEIDPNLGSSLDAMKSYCDFTDAVPKTCVDNTTSVSQVSYLNMLHTHVSQTIHLPCGIEGPFR